MFLFFSMLLLCLFFRLKELFQVKNGSTKSLLFLKQKNAKNLGRSDDAKQRKKGGWPYSILCSERFRASSSRTSGRELKKKRE